MKLLKVLGQVGAAAAAVGGLILAGKTGFGSDLFSSKETGPDTDDLTEVPVMPEETETTEVETETATEEEVPE